jgi:hypothetical protein
MIRELAETEKLWAKRYRAPSHYMLEGLPLEHHSARHGVQTRRGRAEKWCRLDGHNQLPKLVLGAKF